MSNNEKLQYEFNKVHDISIIAQDLEILKYKIQNFINSECFKMCECENNYRL